MKASKFTHAQKAFIIKQERLGRSQPIDLKQRYVSIAMFEDATQILVAARRNLCGNRTQPYSNVSCFRELVAVSAVSNAQRRDGKGGHSV